MTVLLAATLIAQASPNTSYYLRHATYLAGSARPDPTAIGGYGTSDNLPKPVASTKGLSPGLNAKLTIKDGKVSVVLANGSANPMWLRAADSNILGFLEARDAKGQWQPIEYHNFVECGNSFHRVELPSTYAWTFESVLPVGKLATKVRWRLGASGPSVISQQVSAKIHAEAFQLSPELTDQCKLCSDLGYPILMPKFLGL